MLTAAMLALSTAAGAFLACRQRRLGAAAWNLGWFVLAPVWVALVRLVVPGAPEQPPRPPVRAAPATLAAAAAALPGLAFLVAALGNPFGA